MLTTSYSSFSVAFFWNTLSVKRLTKSLLFKYFSMKLNYAESPINFTAEYPVFDHMIVLATIKSCWFLFVFFLTISEWEVKSLGNIITPSLYLIQVN